MENGLSPETQKLAQNSVDITEDFHLKAPDLSHIPENILHTATVEALISQNEDLMARLKVHIRRDVLLEQEILSLRKKVDQSLQIEKNKKDLHLIWEEKDKAWKEKYQNLEQELKKTHAHQELTEVRYAELYETFQQKQKDFSEEKKALRHEVEKKKAEVEMKKIETSETHKRLKRNVTDLTEYINEQKKRFDQELVELISLHEKERKEFKKEIEQLSQENKSLNTRVHQLEPLIEDKALLNNELIIARRGKSEVEGKLKAEMKELQEKVSFYRTQTKTQALEIKETLRLKEDISQELIEYKENLEKQSVQNENLNLLWREKQKQVEDLQEQNTALGKINEGLSQELSNLRQNS